MDGDFTVDDFLGGKVRLQQPVDGYRATSDAVILAAAADVREGDRVLDVGTGTGAVALCLLARCSGVSVTGIDIQDEMLNRARVNANLNGKGDCFSVVKGNVAAAKIDGVETGRFDWVVTNPPFMSEDQESPDKVRDVAHREENCPLKKWVESCLRYVAPRGRFLMINRADRLPEICAVLYPKVAGIKILPVFTKEGEPAKRVLVCARKGVRSAAVVNRGLVLTLKDGSRSAAAENIMRYGAALSF